MLRKHSGHVKAKRFNRAENAVRTLKQHLGNVIDFAESQPVVPRNTRELGLIAPLQEYAAHSRRLLAQDRDTPGKDKIYSFHEPQVECIAKGKVHTRHSFCACTRRRPDSQNSCRRSYGSGYAMRLSSGIRCRLAAVC